MPLFESQITYTFFLPATKDSGLEIAKKLSNCLAISEPLRLVFIQGVSNYYIYRIKKALAECVLQETVKTFYLQKKSYTKPYF